MPIPIPNALVEFILLGPQDDRRQLQDTPILGDVWVRFGRKPSEAVDLLIAPYRGLHAGSVAAAILDGLTDAEAERANIAYLQGLVVARLKFEEVLAVIVPKTKWWIDKWDKPTESPAAAAPRSGRPPAGTAPGHEMRQYTRARVEQIVKDIIQSAKQWHEQSEERVGREWSPLDRFVALAGLTLWAADHNPRRTKLVTPADQIEYILEKAKAKDVSQRFAELLERMLENKQPNALIYQVSLNREAMPALTRSIPAVKADAARTLFKVSCKDITWAVIDSGIDGSHPAFRDADGNSRVKRSFDFKEFRRIVSLSNAKGGTRRDNAALLLRNLNLLNPPAQDDAEAALERLARDALERGPIHWDLVQRFVEIKPATPPASNHGTHVAGIIGASREAATAAPGARPTDDFADGMCPDISLFDFRVLAPDVRDTEFAIIAVLQFIRYLNDQDKMLTVHGANLSLSIPHDVRNYACGRTPICDECERLVEGRVVVVAAAGNHGYKSFETKEGVYDSYAAFSITDPGNAADVITVGATHRFWPHTYGVSFFSSRGPTGDGRIKPDLVAPGERIRAPLPGGDWGDLDGTSMAAPHVSGAAAMLMARYSELVGQPRRIKRVLCESATDLGRERSFQGNGMLDVLRAFQSV